MSVPAESQEVSDFRKWFVARGGYIQENIHLKQGDSLSSRGEDLLCLIESNIISFSVDSGVTVCASNELPADTTVMSCPFSVAITPELATRALSDLFKTSSVHGKWNDRQLICAYICLHWALSSDLPPALVHRPYLDILPGEAQLRTPLYFTPDELEAFKGTNLYGIAVDSRRAEWQAECEQCQRDIQAHDEATGKGITWLVWLLLFAFSQYSLMVYTGLTISEPRHTYPRGPSRLLSSRRRLPSSTRPPRTRSSYLVLTHLTMHAERLSRGSSRTTHPPTRPPSSQ